MPSVAVLISPEVKGAYFSEAVECALAEFRYLFGDCEVEHVARGPMDFLDADLPEERWPELSRLSFFQGAFLKDKKKMNDLSC